jgi:hypothetical protein
MNGLWTEEALQVVEVLPDFLQGVVRCGCCGAAAFRVGEHVDGVLGELVGHRFGGMVGAWVEPPCDPVAHADDRQRGHPLVPRTELSPRYAFLDDGSHLGEDFPARFQVQAGYFLRERGLGAIEYPEALWRSGPLKRQRADHDPQLLDRAEVGAEPDRMDDVRGVLADVPDEFGEQLFLAVDVVVEPGPGDPGTWRRAGMDTATERTPLAESDAFSLDYLQKAFAGALGGAELHGNRSRWMRFRTVSLPRWHHENVVLIGDAAHTAHYSVGSGTKMALEDAIVLADSLTTGGEPLLAPALRRYEGIRRPRVEALQDAAVRSQRWWESIGHRLDLPAPQLMLAYLSRGGVVSASRLAPRGERPRPPASRPRGLRRPGTHRRRTRRRPDLGPEPALRRGIAAHERPRPQ